MPDDAFDRLPHDEQLVAFLRRLNPDDPRRRDLECHLGEQLVGALCRRAILPATLTREDLHLIARVAATEFIDHTLLSGRWRIDHGQTIADALVAQGLEVVAELRCRQGPDGEGFARLRRLVLDLPAHSRVQAVSELVGDTEPAALAVILLLGRGHAAPDVARSLDVDEEIVRVVTARFWSRFDRAVGAGDPGASECDMAH